ncbi:hypothetical protein BDV25DRAFT_158627 [Aspergillus avenaceus]|uniref:Secreted protein n=1 Tax=Aspergillus avenaceus TaxID=36643 RepID=A0A5N6TPJ0_ASPAV|nr:hypothetical protein BDV25DRAFT_158627 [Aspergillus avenaceus]
MVFVPIIIVGCTFAVALACSGACSRPQTHWVYCMAPRNPGNPRPSGEPPVTPPTLEPLPKGEPAKKEPALGQEPV